MDIFGQNKSQANSTIPTENWTSVSNFTAFHYNYHRLSCTSHRIFSLMVFLNDKMIAKLFEK